MWDAESGRAIFCATMPLKVFHTYLRMLRFDDRESRPKRHATDKLAAIREVWDKCAEWLPYLYNPGPDITVDEELVSFRGSSSCSSSNSNNCHTINAFNLCVCVCVCELVSDLILIIWFIILIPFFPFVSFLHTHTIGCCPFRQYMPNKPAR